ncbi:UBN2 domain-containing protein, partial [Cephalotus follicularis]
KMMTFLKAYDLWETIVKGYTPPQRELPDDTLVSLIKEAEEESTKNFKAFSFLHSTVSKVIFPRAKEAREILEQGYQGSDRTRAIRLLNLRRDLANLKMKESEKCKRLCV